MDTNEREAPPEGPAEAPAPGPEAVLPAPAGPPPEPPADRPSDPAPEPVPGPPPLPSPDRPSDPPPEPPAADSPDGPVPPEGIAGGRAPGIAGLSRPYRVLAALALAAVAVTTGWHLAMVFLHVAPANTVSKRHSQVVDDWIYPEFEQNWKLFAPNPLQQNIAVQVRAELRTPSGERVTTGWRDLSADDGAAIEHNPLPSHVDQNELRRAWDFFTGSHDDQNKPSGERGTLSEAYLRRIAVRRLYAHDPAGILLKVQLRSATRSVAAPPFGDEKTDTQAFYRELPWWKVTRTDLPASASGAQREETAP
ncbi:DUF5819 family protein [Streptomyces sp. NPDC089919]|uniref:DUF5819 family protein n=1 Tax=Streptomyces sp. NPDC089919 TaxID=3155188 RepID=UPI003443031C